MSDYHPHTASDDDIQRIRHSSVVASRSCRSPAATAAMIDGAKVIAFLQMLASIAINPHGGHSRTLSRSPLPLEILHCPDYVRKDRKPSTHPLSAGSEQRSKARQIQSKRTEFVCPSSTVRCPLARLSRHGTAFDG